MDTNEKIGDKTQIVALGKEKIRVLVACRVVKKVDQVIVDEWRPVKGIMKPADFYTRRFTVSQFLKSEQLTRVVRLKQNRTRWLEQARPLDEDGIVLMTSPSEKVIDWPGFNDYE